MNYKIGELSKLANISRRTIRYYNQIGLLSPSSIDKSGYSIYSEEEVNKLQQILFFKALGMELKEIKRLIYSKNYDRKRYLQIHKERIIIRRKQLDLLINNIEKSIKSIDKEIDMNDEEKFAGLKYEYIKENEKLYGKEIISKYGEDSFNSSNDKILQMGKKEFNNSKKLEEEILDLLDNCFEEEALESTKAKKLVEKHKKWICNFWQKFEKDSYISLVNSYCEDERFAKYYNRGTKGKVDYLREAILFHIDNLD